MHGDAAPRAAFGDRVANVDHITDLAVVGAKTARKPGATSGLASNAMTDPADAEARRRILSEYGTTFFVEAAAGTGKTSRTRL
jgi:hypothetical protein